MGQFFGKYDTICSVFVKESAVKDDDIYIYQSDFGYLRDDGLMVIALKGTLTDGASIPRLMWRVCGHPLSGQNKFWAAGHDAGYKGTVIIIDTNILQPCTPNRVFRMWRTLNNDKAFIHRKDLPRSWWDKNMAMCMKDCGEPAWKIALVYAGVRIGGMFSFKKL